MTPKTPTLAHRTRAAVVTMDPEAGIVGTVRIAIEAAVVAMGAIESETVTTAVEEGTITTEALAATTDLGIHIIAAVHHHHHHHHHYTAVANDLDPGERGKLPPPQQPPPSLNHPAWSLCWHPI